MHNRNCADEAHNPAHQADAAQPSQRSEIRVEESFALPHFSPLHLELATRYDDAEIRVSPKS